MADENKPERKLDEATAEPSKLQGALSYLPNKFAELRTFLSEVRAELRRVTWPPAQTEVYPTTIVVVVTTILFGVVLYAVDVLLSRGLLFLTDSTIGK